MVRFYNPGSAIEINTRFSFRPQFFHMSIRIPLKILPLSVQCADGEASLENVM